MKIANALDNNRVDAVIGNAAQRAAGRGNRMQQPGQQGPWPEQMNAVANFISAMKNVGNQQQGMPQAQAQQQPMGGVGGNPFGGWGYTPQPQNPYVQATGVQGNTSRDVANINAQSQSERNPWDALQTTIGSYPGVYGPAVQGTVANNAMMMDYAKFQQILPLLQAMQGGGMQTDYGAGYA